MTALYILLAIVLMALHFFPIRKLLRRHSIEIAQSIGAEHINGKVTGVIVHRDDDGCLVDVYGRQEVVLDRQGEVMEQVCGILIVRGGVIHIVG